LDKDCIAISAGAADDEAPVATKVPEPAAVDSPDSLSESELESAELLDAMPLDFPPFFLLAFCCPAVLLSSRGSATGASGF
jgi:hypothetical protein